MWGDHSPKQPALITTSIINNCGSISKVLIVSWAEDMQTLHVIRNYITTSHYYDHALGSKVQTRKSGHLEENCPITTFSLNKRSRFSIFFEQTNIFKYSTNVCNRWKKNLPDLSEHSPHICECYCFSCKKNLRIFCFPKHHFLPSVLVWESTKLSSKSSLIL